MSLFIIYLPIAGQLPVDRAGRHAVPPEAEREGGPQAVPRRLHRTAEEVGQLSCLLKSARFSKKSSKFDGKSTNFITCKVFFHIIFGVLFLDDIMLLHTDR